MGMDIDAVVANKSIEELRNLLLSMEHGRREKIADDIIEFTDKMKIKYYKNN